MTSSTVLQDGKAKEVGLQSQEITIYVNATLLSSSHLTIRLDLTDLGEICCSLEKKSPHLF